MTKCAELASSNGALQQALDTKEAELKSKSDQIDYWRSQKEAIDAQVQEAREECSKLTRDNSALQQELSVRNAELKSKTDQASTYLSQKNTADAQLDKMKASVEKMRGEQTKELQKARDEYSKLSKDLLASQQTLSAKDAELKGKSDQLTFYMNQKRSVDSELEKLKSGAGNSSVQKEIERVMTKCAELASSNGALQQALDTKEAELKSKSDQINTYLSQKNAAE